ncbi:MAG TPA: ParB/RepB/Spo0J family partition protein [Candidatus Saccharimonadales bacterium]|nr:ParB/RepB/Spo0J family partition protein [Candidatus Saccharimonadales bacterium]
MAQLNKGLGKSFGSLIPTDFDKSLLMDAGERIQNILISDIKPNPDQPRRTFEKIALVELSSSIKQFGVLQPIILVPVGDNEYKIVSGERRWRAAQLAGLEKIPAIVRLEEQLRQLEIALIENVQRVDLSPLEQATSIERLHHQFNLTYAQIAERLGKAVTTLNNIVRLLQLPTEARQALEAGQITEGHARAILALKDMPDQQDNLLKLIKSRNWSVRQAEQYVRSHREGIVKPQAVSRQMSKETPETKVLSSRLEAPVSLYRTAKGGRLEIHFSSEEQLKKLFQVFKNLK